MMICQIINHKAMNIKFRSDYPIIMMNCPALKTAAGGSERESVVYYVPIKIYQHTKWVEITDTERETVFSTPGLIREIALPAQGIQNPILGAFLTFRSFFMA